MRSKNPPSVLVLAAMFAIILIVALIMALGEMSGDDHLVRTWVNQNNYQLIEYERCLFDKGPWWWSATKDQRVYYIKVVDQNEHRHDFWYRIGWWVEEVQEAEGVK